MPTLLSLESRRATEIAALIDKLGRPIGADPFVAPSMQEVPLDECPEVHAFGEALFDGRVDAIVFLTGVGAEALLARLEPIRGRDETLRRLDGLRVFIRGPKPAAVLKKWGTHVDVRAPEPNTWEDLVAAIDAAGCDLAGLTVAVQEYGQPNAALHAALRARGATVISVPVYRWQLPDDTGPLERAAAGLMDDRFAMLLLTSAQQIRHLIAVAERTHAADAFAAALGRVPIASIGPTATQTLNELGLEPVMEPSHPKMGHLVREAVAWLGGQPSEEQSPGERPA